MRAGTLLLLLLGLSAGPAFAAGPSESTGSAAPAIDIEDLGDGLIRAGNILIDKPAGRFSVPGRIMVVDKPLEYIAVADGGYKAYESLLELETTGTAFKLACILIGLDDSTSVKPRRQFDDREAEGDAVALWISWDGGDGITSVPAEKALLEGGSVFGDGGWVYTGSVETDPASGLLADAIGSLISFVHDPVAVIDHRTGAGIGAYGSITGNAELLPPEGAPVTLSVVVRELQGGEEAKTTTGE
ncbi:YdjY domain-containing protein [Lentisalinibacter salinarum]|uniref:YdjY domain-containing protein n=1 Tax=Lentisalinibacter salinarum TaxID=2992239 RepID=UPI00386BF740